MRWYDSVNGESRRATWLEAGDKVLVLTGDNACYVASVYPGGYLIDSTPRNRYVVDACCGGNIVAIAPLEDALHQFYVGVDKRAGSV
ncbi:MAG: hypothetical protein IKK39_10200 [Thermoguttaceae bacterium]|nr:hypothetical protein [Thermoguttaceae bacterium]MBR4104416.1 hypothetical protein [Thermoguttaceae bacterium]